MMAYTKPAEAFSPGEYLRDELEARGWNQTEFAEIIGRPSRLISQIIAGKRGITPQTANAIAAALGTSPELWMNLDSAYQLFLADPAPERIAKEAMLREKFPVREMIKRGWIEPSQSYDVLLARILAFYGIRSLEEKPSLSHAARRNDDADLSYLQLTWLFRVKQLATGLQVPPYDEKKLRAALTTLESLMTEPEEIRHVPKILADCGVRLVIVEPMPGSKINGVCFWLDDKNPVIGLTLKGEFIDLFWFDLRHEIEHVLRGDGKERAMIDAFDLADTGITDACEKAANIAATNFCVPEKDITRFITRHDPVFSEQNFIGFAHSIKRHPGIVAGQLQRRLAKGTLFKKHQVKVRQIVTKAALTDGYGCVPPI